MTRFREVFLDRKKRGRTDQLEQTLNGRQYSTKRMDGITGKKVGN